jgi:hypothetical protein
MFGKDKSGEPVPRERGYDDSPVGELRAAMLRQDRRRLCRLTQERNSAARWGRPVRDLDARIREVRDGLEAEGKFICESCGAHEAVADGFCGICTTNTEAEATAGARGDLDAAIGEWAAHVRWQDDDGQSG